MEREEKKEREMNEYVEKDDKECKKCDKIVIGPYCYFSLRRYIGVVRSTLNNNKIRRERIGDLTCQGKISMGRK